MMIPRSRIVRTVLIAGATVLIAGVIYQGTASHSSAFAASGAKGKQVYVQTANVTAGMVKQTVSLSGIVVSRNTVDIVPTASGMIASINVHTGEHVTAGQVLAQLSDFTQLAQLQIAEGNLAAAKGKLAQIGLANSPQSIAIAQDNVTIAKARLQALQSGPSSSAVVQANTAVVNAEHNLAQLKQEQALIDSPHGTAAVAFQNASQVLTQIQTGQNPVSVAVENATQAVNDLESGTAPQNVALQNAQSSAATASTSVQTAQSDLTTVQSSSSPQGVQVANDQNALNQAQNNLSTLQSELAQATSSSTSSVSTLQSEVEAEQTTVSQDQAKLAEDQASWTNAISGAESQLSASEASAAQQSQANANNTALLQAQEQQSLQNAQGALATAKAQAAASLSNAQAAVASAQANNSSAQMQINAQVSQAQNALAVAQANRQALMAPSTSSSLTEAQAQVNTALQQLQALLHPANSGTLAAAQGNVQTVQGQVALAQTALQNMTLLAPISGVISQRYDSVGSLAGAQKPVFSMIGKTLEVQATLDQQQLGAIRPGDTVNFTLPSNPNQAEVGTVYSVSPTANVQTLSFTVTILPKGSVTGMAAGETAQAQIVTHTLPHALLIPTAAISMNHATPQVYVVENHRAVLKNITTGAVDGTMTQVTSGLSAGQQVVTMGQTFLASGDRVTVANNPSTSSAGA